MSAALLDAIGGGGLVRADGLPWLDGTARALSVDSFTAKILCSRHNSALSPLDEASAYLFRLLHSIHPARPDSHGGLPDTCIGIVNGHDVERWCAKALIGLCYSGNLHPGGEPMQGERPGRVLLEFLFGERAYLPRGRLYLTNPSRPLPQHEGHVSVTPLTVDDKVVAGLSVQLAGLEFAFLPSGGEYASAAQGVNRPSELVVPTAAGIRRVVISWDHGGSGQLAIMEQRPLSPPGTLGPP